MATSWLKRARGWTLPVIALAMFSFGVAAVIRPARMQAAPPLPPASAAGVSSVGAIGIVEPESELIAIASELPGVARQVYVRAGDHVRQGQPLFRLDERALMANAATAQAQVESAQAQLRAAQAALGAARIAAGDQQARLQLYKSVPDERAISRDERDRQRYAAERSGASVDEAAAQVSVATAGVKTAEAELARVRTDLARLTVAAPIDGRIWRVNVRPGEFAPAGPQSEPLMTIGADSRMHVRVEIAEEDIARIDANRRAQGQMRGDTARRVPLTFVRFEPEARDRRSLSGGGERVDTRVIEALYSFDPQRFPAFVGQRMDVFIDATPLPLAAANGGK